MALPADCERDPMRLSLRFVLPLILVLAGIAYAVAPLVDKMTLSWFIRDLEIRSSLIANSHRGSTAGATGGRQESQRSVSFSIALPRMNGCYAIGYCDVYSKEQPLASRSLPTEIDCADLDRLGSAGRTTCCRARVGPCMWQ